VLQRLHGILNRVPIDERAVRVGDTCLYVDSLDRGVTALAWTGGWMAKHETLLLDRVLRRGKVAVDVGANIAFHTLGIARRVGPGGRVHALEPAQANYGCWRGRRVSPGLSAYPPPRGGGHRRERRRGATPGGGEPR
jgi:hypothetical protein